jgi:NTE family protein
LPGCVLAQSAPRRPAERPKVGLVLSGGGARGGAEIGALEALEQLHVPIDYIAGTSIGAAIGGLYASGMSVSEMESFVKSINWDAAFLNMTPRRLRSFRRKRDDDLFLVDQQPGLNHGRFELPRGVVQGQVIDTIMTRELLPVATIKNFDNLMIPFRAVAGDIVTGHAVVLGSGDLAKSIRASMSVPAAISPVEIDGRLLVDGGIAMNLPVQAAKDMGADRIVAIDVTDPLATREELRSIVDVTGQLTALLTRAGLDPQLKMLGPKDVLVQPKFSQTLSPVNFARMSEGIQTGYEAVMKHRKELEPLMLSDAAYAAYRASLHNPRAHPAMPKIEFIHLTNDSPIADSVIRARLNDIEIGQPLDVHAVERDLNKVYGLEFFQNVRYSLVRQNGQYGLDIDLEARSWGPNYLQLGVQYSSSSDVDAVFNLAASYLRTAINPLGAEWRTTVFIGDEPAFLADLYEPLGNEAKFFVEPSLDIGTRQLNLFNGDDLAAELRVRQGMLAVAAGRELASFGEIRAGLRHGYGQTRLKVGDPSLLPPAARSFHRGELFARFSVDTLDSVSFPRSGVLNSIEWRGSRRGTLSADASYDQWLVDGAYAKTWGRHTLLATWRFDTTSGGTAPIDRMYRFGGFMDLAGLNQNQLSGQDVARVGASYYRRIGHLALFPAFAGVSVEVGNVWQDRGAIGWRGARSGASLWGGVDTPVGPIYVGYGVSNGGPNAFYVYLGRVF